MSEKNFENRLKKYLESKGVCRLGDPKHNAIGYYTKRWGGGLYAPAGLPDLQVMVNGYCIDIEIKDRTGIPSRLQLQKIRQINNSGGVAILLYPQDFNDFTTWFDMVAELKTTKLERGLFEHEKRWL